MIGKIFQYLIIANIYKKAKKEIVLSVTLLLFLFIGTAMINDFMKITQGEFVYILVILKWFIIILFVGIILKIIKKAIILSIKPLPKKEKTNEKKQCHHNIMQKKILLTESEMILQKYRRDNE